MISNTKRILKSVGYVTVAFLTAALAKEQNSTELFSVFALASGTAAAGASCCLIAAWEDVKDQKERKSSRLERDAQHDQVLPEQGAEQETEDSSPTTPEA